MPDMFRFKRTKVVVAMLICLLCTVGLVYLSVFFNKDHVGLTGRDWVFIIGMGCVDVWILMVGTSLIREANLHVRSFTSSN